jgi:hypothetical protein
MTPLLKNLLVLLAIIAVGGLGYYLFFMGGDTSIVTSGMTSGASPEAAMQTREFERILNELNTIDIESTLLTNGEFLQLRDHTLPIAERPYGRSNPFQIVGAPR